MEIESKSICDLLQDPQSFIDDGSAYELLKEVWRGLPVDSLRPLLRHVDSRVRRAAVWVASELGENACELLDDVIPLVDAENAVTVLCAMEVVLVCSDSRRPWLFLVVARQLAAAKEDSRYLAIRYVARASIEQIVASSRRARIDRLQQELVDGLAWLTADEVDEDDVISRLQSSDRIRRSIAASAVSRFSLYSQRCFGTMLSSSDDIVREFGDEVLDYARNDGFAESVLGNDD